MAYPFAKIKEISYSTKYPLKEFYFFCKSQKFTHTFAREAKKF